MGFLKNRAAEWKAWWQTLSTWKKILPALLLVIYWLVLLKVDGLRDDIVYFSSFQALLYYGGPYLRPIFHFIFPVFLTGTIYDSQRYYADLIRGPIHVKEPYAFDKYFFGIPTPEGVLTPNEWWQKHTHPLLDFITGIAYIIFIPVFVFTCGYFQFFASRKGTLYCSAENIRLRAPQMMWGFFIVNVIGYSTYYWYAASPPWYAALYGFGPARIDIPPNLAGCARFDELVGMPIFQNWYGRSADVHGAIPSLHIAYPLMGFYYAMRFGALRIFTLSFFLLMCFSAVYLNHHYILDILWGSAYAILVSLAMDMWWNQRLKMFRPPVQVFSPQSLH